MKKKILSRAAVFLVVAASLLLVAKARWDSMLYDGYNPGLPLLAEIESDEMRDDYRRLKLSFQGLEGEDRVPALLAMPKDDSQGPFPCAIFLHGIGQKKEFLDEIAAPFVERGFAFASFDQYTRGERRLKDPSKLDELLALRKRCGLTVNETRRLVDYLQGREDISPDRIYLVGASFGAITGATAFAFDTRFHAGVMTYGGGDFPVLFANEQASEMAGAGHMVLANALAFIMAPADPVKHLAKAAPRPILFQNGREDSLIAPESAQALFDAAKQPKEILWYDGDHVGLDREHTMAVLKDALAWLLYKDLANVEGVDAASHAT